MTEIGRGSAHQEVPRWMERSTGGQSTVYCSTDGNHSVI